MYVRLCVDELEDDTEKRHRRRLQAFCRARQCFPCGARTSRPNRLPYRPFIPGENRESDRRRHFGIDGEWGRIFFQPIGLPGSLAWDDFCVKFRTPLPLFTTSLIAQKSLASFLLREIERRGMSRIVTDIRTRIRIRPFLHTVLSHC